MTRSLTTSDRVILLLSIVPFLRERGATPVTELAEAFSVDERVLRRLIPFLATAGVPGETQTYQHEDLFDIDWDAFETHDLVSLQRVVAVDDTPRFSSLESAALLAGLHALLPVLPDTEREHADQAAAKLAAVGEASRAIPVSVTPDSAPSPLAALGAAMDGGVRVEFHYRDAHGAATRRRVEPLGLIDQSGAWYLRAYCLDRAAERTFAVDRMRDVAALPEAAERRPHRRDADTIARPPLDGGVARIRVRASAVHRLAGFAPAVTETGADGWVRAEVELRHPEVAVRLVQIAPGEVIVEDPPAAREAVAEWVGRALALHDA